MMKIQHSVLGMCATNTYYVYDDETKRGLIVDPADSPDTIIAKADSLSMIPEAILITHGHFDHVLAMNKVREHYGIKVYAGLTEKQVLHDMAMNLTSSFGMGQIFDADIYLKDGEEFETAGYHIKAIEVPGHTIGGMCYYFDKQGVLFQAIHCSASQSAVVIFREEAHQHCAEALRISFLFFRNIPRYIRAIWMRPQSVMKSNIILSAGRNGVRTDDIYEY